MEVSLRIRAGSALCSLLAHLLLAAVQESREAGWGSPVVVAVASEGANPGALTPRVSSCPVLLSRDHVRLTAVQSTMFTQLHQETITVRAQAGCWVLKNQADWCPYLAFLLVVVAKESVW